MSTAVTERRRPKLLAIDPEIVEAKKPKCLIYGAPGVGKTWASLDWPSVYYVDTEGGADLNHYRRKLKNAGGKYLGPDQGSLDFETVIGQVQALATGPHRFKTIVFDSISRLWGVALAEEQERLGDKDAFGAYKKIPTRRMEALLRWVNRADLNAIFIAHEKELWGLNDKRQREVIGFTYDGYEKLAYDLHLVLHIYKTGATHRARIGKSRLTGFPEGEIFEWSYAAFAERYGRDVIEKDVQPIAIATPEQIAEIQRLLGIVKVPEGMTAKWLKAAGVETWEEMDADKVNGCLAYLKERITP